MCVYPHKLFRISLNKLHTIILTLNIAIFRCHVQRSIHLTQKLPIVTRFFFKFIEIAYDPATSTHYADALHKSLEEPEEFWADEARRLIDWDKPFTKVLDDSRSPFTKWFVGGRLNACYNAVDRHVERGHGDKVAIIHDSPMTNSVRHVTYAELYDQVARLAGGLRKLGVGKGDRVVIYMPLIPEAIVAMLAVVRLGAVHSVVFGGRVN